MDFTHLVSGPIEGCGVLTAKVKL